ncbi:SLC5 family protein [candidate division KSB1 bacterium]
MSPTVLMVAGIYFALTLSLGLWVARREKKTAHDYFLAGRSLPWYAVSLSMTGSNIGTEHFIGMVGTAYLFGLAPATFEWGNFIPYTILAFIFLPYFYRKKLFTIPQFLEQRYNATTRTVFAAMSLLHMVLAYLAPALYAGGRILYEMGMRQTIDSFNWGFMGCVLIIAGVTAAYCIYGGLISVVWTDVLQVVILLAGGTALVLTGIDRVGSLERVIDINLTADASRFSLILPADHTVSPWTGVATFWFTLSLWYVGTNQFYIQRCLGAKSEWDAKMGVIGCAGLKLFLPFIIVFPGLVAFSLFGPGLPADAVYTHMVNDLLPPLGRGVLLAVLIAAIMSTVSSVLNSSSTIWSMDIYRRYLRRDATDEQTVRVGRWSAFTVIIIGTALAPLLLMWKGGIFIYIQDMAAFFAPSIAVIFLAAFLWPRAHSRAATITLIFGIVSGIILKIFAESWGADGIEILKPLLNRAAVNWALCLMTLVATTYLVPPVKGKTFDRDAIWNSRWARLPESDRFLNRGGRNLIFWWIVMMAASGSLFVIFR